MRPANLLTAVECAKLTIKFEDGRVKEIIDAFVTRRRR
jgi:hypothetical protein